ncbi:xylulokinase [Arthrobacter sp. EH-1B-1]|uniref:Xylulose kinase n=1 Tax=Arthrobacter vasquezii TaxID=2977629 RepID=A0ABT6CTN6_9MICC|nr:xylulokinase [Arthrobacter vasquezii]MDF9277427.1 xylulokinase [Arthrobacter vasquezii]
MPIAAGVDSSTQSCTIEVRDADSGLLLGSGRAAHPPTTPPRSEQDPEGWWTAFVHALTAAATDAGVRVSEIDAISIAGQCHGMVLLNSAGEALRPAKLWNDTESTPQARDMVAALGKEGWARAVGSVPTAAFTITKLAWVAAHEPELINDIARVLLPHDYLTFRLTGRAVTDRSEASGTAYYAAHENRWRTDLLDRFVSADVDWSTALPDVLGPSEPAGTASTAAAREAGLRADVIVAPGAGDTHAGALGMGMRLGDVGYSLGTSGVVFATSPHTICDETGWVNGVSDATGIYLPVVCTLNATKVTDTVARLMGVDLGTLGELALDAMRDAERPVLAAYLDGERSPDRPNATGILQGLTTTTTREQFALSAFEGVLLGLYRGQEAIERLGVPTDGDIVLMGGGARGAAYRQVLADLTGRPVITKDAPEAVAAGACTQAAAVLDGTEVTVIRDRWTPRISSTTVPRETVRVNARYGLVADWSGADPRAL